MAWSLVNTAAFGNGGAASSVATIAGVVFTTGNLIVVTIGGASTTATVTSITDTAGNTYVQCAGARNNAQSGAGFVDIWYCANCTGNADNFVTVNFSASINYRHLHVMQYSSTNPAASPFEVAAIGSTAAGTSATSASFSPANAGNLNVAVGNTNAGGTFTAGTNYVVQVSSSSPDRATEDRENAPAGAQTAAITFSTSCQVEISVASFKEAVAAKAPPPRQRRLWIWDRRVAA